MLRIGISTIIYPKHILKHKLLSKANNLVKLKLKLLLFVT